MNLGQYLHELLLEHESVIIPGFGAFISNYKPAEINEGSNEITPPSKEITFNRKIRNNDGLLVGFVAEVQSVSHFDALKIIEKEREDILYQLDKGEQIILEDIGTLFLNDNNEIEFKPQTQKNLLLDSFGLESISLNKEEFEQEKENTTEPVFESENFEETDDGSGDEIITSGTVLEDSELENVDKTEQKNEVSDRGKVTEPKTEAIRDFAMDLKQNQKKTKWWIWVIPIFIVLVLGGFFLLRNNFVSEDSKDFIIQEDSETTPETHESNVVLDTVIKDSIQTAYIDTTITKNEENIIAENADSATFRFYLVGGSFKDEENAQKFMEHFNAEGYEPYLLGKRGNFYIVVIGRYSTEKKAVIARDTFMKRNPGSGIWVFEDNQD